MTEVFSHWNQSVQLMAQLLLPQIDFIWSWTQAASENVDSNELMTQVEDSLIQINSWINQLMDQNHNHYPSLFIDFP